MKQVPVLFALMSGKETTDYISVLKAFKEMLGETIMLEEVMLDFEPALWRAFDDVFGYLDIVIHGCYFHWKQAIMHHISIRGLKKTYDNGSSNARILLKQLLALPILPEDQVKPIFAILKKNSLKVEEQDNMKKLFDYVQKQWIEARTFPPSKWSIFNIEFRTNNDLEGYNNKFDDKLSYYKLIRRIMKGCKDAVTTIDLVKKQKISRSQKRIFIKGNENMFLLWKEYEEKKISSWDLLDRGRQVYTL